MAGRDVGLPIVAEYWGPYAGASFPTNYVRHSFWGLDLSGSLSGAGGVGGLLMVQEAGNSYLPAYDALGNVHAMIKASDGSLAAAYDGARQGEDGQTEGLPEGRGSAGHPWGGGPRQYDAFGQTLP